jgi:nicotinamide-nucleotide amidase
VNKNDIFNPMLQCQIISIGDELLRGDTVNTNASWMSSVLTEIGVKTVKVQTIPDDIGVIKQALKEAASQVDVVLTTGGLGPTHDDMTKRAVTDFYNTALIVHEPTLNYIKETFKKRGIPFSRSNYHQAEVPENCDVLFNKHGTAPGLWFEEKSYWLGVLPGIPQEVKYLMKCEVLPLLQSLTEDVDKSYSRFIKTAGIGESTLSDEVLPELGKFLSEDVSVAFLPSPQENTLRITTEAQSKDEADGKSRFLVQYIYKQAEIYIIGEGKDLTLSEVVGEHFRTSSLTISTAESCTGGLLASRLTDIPGSSDYMIGGLTAYDNNVKMKQLHIPEEMLQKYGAVSLPVALQMAKSAASVFGTDIGASTTGIAGPAGGSRKKPVGTVWVGFWSKEDHFALRAQFSKNRQMNKERSVALALETVRRTVLKIETMPYGLKPHRA